VTNYDKAGVMKLSSCSSVHAEAYAPDNMTKVHNDKKVVIRDF
jgi:hypothetical protein